MLKGVVDLQSAIAIVLAAALMVGAFEEEYRNNELHKNLIPSKSEGSDGIANASCDHRSVNGRQACMSQPFPLDGLPRAQFAQNPGNEYFQYFPDL